MKILSFFAILIFSISAFASTPEMSKLVELTNGKIYGGRVPDGYRAVKLNAAPMNANFKAYLSAKTKEKVVSWKKFVLGSDEFSHLGVEARRAVAANPWKELGVKYLLEVEEVYEIYKGRKLIGYFIEINDHVQAAIYQDGAWIEAFFNSELTLVKAFDKSA